MGIAERVKLAREKRGMSQRQLAARADTSPGYISQLEAFDGTGGNGKIEKPSLKNAKAIADALEVPFEWLAFGDGAEPDWGTPGGGEAA